MERRELASTKGGPRRARVLRQLVHAAEDARCLDAYFARAADLAAELERDLPFLLFYVLDDDRSRACRVAHVGALPGTDAAPEIVDLVDGPSVWPFAEAITGGRPLAVDDLAQRWPGLSAVERAYVLPIAGMGARVVGLVVAGVGAGRGGDQASAGFFDAFAATLAAGAVATTLVAAERDRADVFAQLDKEKTAFLSHLSQEFRRRLMLVLSPLEEELEERDAPLPPGRRARLEIAHRNSAGLQRTVSALLDFSFIEEGRMKPAFEAVDIVSVTDAIVTTFRGPIEKAGLRLSTRLEVLPGPVHVDREMWTKIVSNLLSNALKHTFRGGITVSIVASEEVPDHIELRVDDTGTGIPAREIPRLFTRFHRVRGVRSRSDDGSGIGLALVRAFARLHDGDVRVVSREGLGSSFRVHVPRGAPARAGGARAQGAVPADAAADADQAMRWTEALADDAPESAEVPLGEAAEGPRARVLWAHGNSDTRAYVARLVGRAHQVEAVADADSVLGAVAEHSPDLVLLDVALPGRDGLGLLRELRENERTRLVPVILVSSSDDEDAAIQGLDAGADDYLVQPFTAKALLARVRSCLALAKLRREYADKLAVANKELEAFGYSVSHDLRAPLRAIDGFSKILASDYAGAFDDDGRRYLDRIRAASQRMAQLIDDLLNLSRITRLQLADEAVDLTALAETVLGDLAARDPERKVASSVRPGLSGRGDPRLVRVLLENLLGNAWKFSSKRADPHLEVGAELREGETIFFVRDNGAGFDMAYAEKLFAPFQRLHAATDFPGTGIGLATVHRVVMRHGGRVWAASALGEGATFFFTLGGPPR